MEKDRVEYDYYYGTQSQQFYFIQIPMELFENMNFKEMSLGAKVLYGLLLKRMHLSKKNDWYDEPDEYGRRRVYIEYAIDSIMKDLNVSKPTAVNLMAELDKVGLVEKKRRPNMATKIYVKNFLAVLNEIKRKEVNEIDLRKLKMLTSTKIPKIQGSQKNLPPSSGSQTFLPPEVKNVYPSNSNININNNLNIYNNPSIYQSNTDDRWMDRKNVLECIRKNIEYDILIQRQKKSQVDEIVMLMLDSICSSAKKQRVNGSYVATDDVRVRFLSLEADHIEYVITSMKKTPVKIRNIRGYILTALYNAPTTIDSYFSAEVNYDLNN